MGHEVRQDGVAWIAVVSAVALLIICALGFGRMEARLDDVEHRVGALEHRVGALEERVDEIGKDVGEIKVTLARIESLLTGE